MTEKTEWVTIKIPEETRERARDDPRTYGEVMEAGLRDEDGAIGLFEAGDSEPVDEVLGADVTMDVADELAKLREQLERVPDRTADQLEGRFR